MTRCNSGKGRDECVLLDEKGVAHTAYNSYSAQGEKESSREAQAHQAEIRGSTSKGLKRRVESRFVTSRHDSRLVKPRFFSLACSASSPKKKIIRKMVIIHFFGKE